MHKKNLISMLYEVCLQVFVYGNVSGNITLTLEKKTNNRGVTLAELIVVISIIGIMIIGLGYSYADWIGKYRVEKATKELYTDLMNVRHVAMARNCAHFADFNFPAPPAGYGTYRMAEDTNEDGEGDADANGIIDTAGHTFLPSFSKKIDYPIKNNFTSKIINFDKRGIVQPNGTICLFSDNDPDYDCIVISQTRIIMGKLKANSNGDCKAENCVKK